MERISKNIKKNKEVLEKLRIFWESHPDLRLGQIIENAKYFSDQPYVDTFSIHDEQIEKGLDMWQKNIDSREIKS